ncbi:hypothetical protein GQ457_11G020250 [Hibiscus cannabinus]
MDGRAGVGDTQRPAAANGEWTAFVDNLSRCISRKTLWEIFRHHGKVVKVFIPSNNRKPNYKFSTFAFIHFASRGDLERAIHRTNKMRIDGRIVVVSKARFASKRIGARSSPKVIPELGNKAGLGGDGRVADIEKTKFVSAMDTRTLKEVLLGKPKQVGIDVDFLDKNVGSFLQGSHDGTVEFYIPEKDTDWINFSLAGLAKRMFDLEFIQQAIMSDGLKAKIVKWGNDNKSCIIIFYSLKEKEEAWSLKREALSYWFDHIGPLKNDDGIPMSFFSVSLLGVPLQYWHESFFSSLGDRWGSFISLDISTKDKLDLSVAKMVIRAASPFDVPKSINVRSNGRTFTVEIRLETACNESGNVIHEDENGNYVDVWPVFEQSIEGESKIDRASDYENLPEKVNLPPNKKSAVDSDRQEVHVELEDRSIPKVDVNAPLFSGNLDVLGKDFGNKSQENFWFSESLSQQMADINPRSFRSHVAAHMEKPTHVDGPVDFFNVGTNVDVGHRESSFIGSESYSGCGDVRGPVAVLQQLSRSVEIVPDSFEGLDQLKEGSHNFSIRADNLADRVEFSSSLREMEKSVSQLCRENNFLNSIVRRNRRRFVRDSLEEAEVAFSNSSLPSLLKNLKSVEEALVVWEVSKVLEISFKGGKTSVVKKVYEIEEADRSGSAGGLLCMWDNEFIAVENKFISNRFMAISGKLIVNNWLCGFINVYGPSVEQDKRVFFEELHSFMSHHSWPWTFVQEAILVDLPLRGGSFTWANNRTPPTLVRLDRFLVSDGFISVFPDLVQELLVKSISVLEGEIHDVEFNIQLGAANSTLFSRLATARAELCQVLRKEECAWIQKSRVKWFQERDRNTKFFHMVASHRRRVNLLNKIQINGIVLSDPCLIKVGVYDFFYKAYNVSTTIEVESLSLEFSKISLEQNKLLEADFTEEEVWWVICSSDKNKAPGPDGFNMLFFKKFWPQLKKEIMKFFKDFHAGRNWDDGINHSFITLIPKKLNPENLEDFRPISLVGGIYKILSKVLACRLRLCADSVIGRFQFAFLPGRQILDCSFIANECIDDMLKKGARGVVFKIDFKRAFDTIGWHFLIRIMEEMNFGKKWREWIFKCISSASISVLVNGSPTERFRIVHGLRQGCTLSPLLFNIIGESLNKMLIKATEKGLFSGFLLGQGQNSMNVTHLQFADDLMIFCEASLEQVKSIKRILRVFELASGLQLNLQKSKLFGINIPESEILVWADAVGCDVGRLPAEYLGLPLGPIGQGPPILAELQAMKIGLLIFLKSRWCYNHRLILESDSKIAVEWVLNVTLCSSLFARVVHEIADLIHMNCIVVRHIARGGNVEADTLAKRGIG